MHWLWRPALFNCMPVHSIFTLPLSLPTLLFYVQFYFANNTLFLIISILIWLFMGVYASISSFPLWHLHTRETKPQFCCSAITTTWDRCSLRPQQEHSSLGGQHFAVMVLLERKRCFCIFLMRKLHFSLLSLIPYWFDSSGVIHSCTWPSANPWSC